MMNDAQLLSELHHLGIDRANARVIALLPLVHVAWVDDVVQPAERAAILGFAQRENLEPASLKVLDGWLSNAPTEAYHQRGRDVIRELAMRNGGLETNLTPEKVDAIVAFCSTVASSAGGLFGVLFTVSDAEKRLITEIADALRVAATEGGGWSDLMGELKTSQPAPERPS